MSDDTYRPSIPPGVDRVEYLRTQVFIERDQVANVSSSDYPGTWHGYDDAWNLDKWKQDFRIIISRLTNTTINFDLIGVHASIANAIRRILIAEVPTMAIEHVYILNNTSCIFDDMLAHRLGLIPIKADPALFECRAKEGPLTDRNTIVFKLYIKCIDNPEARKHAVTRAERYLHSRVLTRDLVWEPQGEQKNVFQSDPIRPVHDDIVIAELAKNQEIEAIMHCVKGIGKDHAKFSPVATATYRLLPEIRLLKSITGEQAYRLQSKFSPGVIAVKEVGGVMIASVAEARNDSISREVLRHKEFENDVVLTRVRDHFIFEVESVGMVQPAVLIVQAMQVLKRKCQLLKQQADNLTIAQEGTSDVPISLSAASTLGMSNKDIVEQ